MRTDELRRALQEMTDIGEPDGAAARREVDRRARRHRTRVGVVSGLTIAAVVVAIVAGVVANHDDKVGIVTTPPPSAKLVALADLDRVDAAVALPADATVGELRAVDAAIAAAPETRRYARVPSEVATFSQWGSCSESIPRWLVAVSSPQQLAELPRSLQRETIVVPYNVARRRWASSLSALERPDADVEVFFTLGATQAQIARVRDALRQERGAASVRFLDHDDAYEEFKRIFRDSPDLVHSVSPEVLPQSYRVDLSDPSDGAAMADRLQALPGIDKVIVADPVRRTTIAPLRALDVPGAGGSAPTCP
jgi:hypothetical protein